MKKEGGLKTKGLFTKKSASAHPLISIVTACLNSEKHIEQCIQSVINQTYGNIEYIIIDGGSTDKTLGIIKKYEDKITYWVSELDRGFYDAINKANNIAAGDYILYLNSDDYLYSDNSIEKAFYLALRGNDLPLLIIGNTQIALENQLLRWIWPGDNKDAIHKYNPPHQAVFIHKEIYKKISYNTLLRISADTEFWRRLRREGLFSFRYIDHIISVFRLGGISNNVNMEFRRYTERAIISFLYLDKTTFITTFNLALTLVRIMILVTFKKILISVLGERFYYKHILYGLYLIRKALLKKC